nr:LOC285679 protein [Homo sapiens]
MPRAQLPEDSSAVDMDILFPLDSVIGTELCPSPIPQIIHFVLFVVFSLVILIILRLYIPREPSSVPPREDSENDQAEVGEWLRIGNKYITLKDYRILLKELENLEIYTFLSKKCLKKLSREGSSHHLPRQVRPGPVYKPAPARNHRPRGGRGKASPTSFHVSPRAPLAPLASMPSSVPKTSVESLGSPSSLSSSKPREPLCPLKHPSHQPPASTLSPNPTSSTESLGLPSRETPHAGRWRQGSRFPQPGCANAAGRIRHQNPRHSHGHRISDIHEQLGIS